MIYTSGQLFALLIPLIIEQLLNVFVGMVDVLMVAAVGETAMSGVSLIDTINILIIQLLGAIATGGAVVCSQYVGKKDLKSAGRAAGQLALVTIIFSSAVAMAALVGGNDLLAVLFGQVEDAVMNNAVIYLRITSFSYPFLALYNSAAAIFRSMGNSKISMKTSFLMNGLNIIGNAICVFGLHMGVEGVAIPTLLSRMAAALLMTYLVSRPSNVIRISGISDLKPHGRMIGNILSIGIPNGVESSLFQFGKLILQSLISTLGTASIAGYAVACNLVTFLYLPGNALGMGLVTIVGRCLGAGETQQAKQYIKKLILYDYVLCGVAAVVLGVFRYFFTGLYNLSPEALEIAAALVLSHCIAMILWPPAFLLPHGLRAGFDTKFTMLTSAFCMWVFRVGLSYVFIKGFHMGAIGVWYAMYIDWVFRFVLYLWRLKSFEKRAKRL